MKRGGTTDSTLKNGGTNNKSVMNGGNTCPTFKNYVITAAL